MSFQYLFDKKNQHLKIAVLFIGDEDECFLLFVLL